MNDLIGSRICHDLISPLGAIGNGIELLSMSSTGAAPELSLISESIGNANARIRFFRVAFGAVGPGSMMGDREIRSILDDLYCGSRTHIDWRIANDLPRGEVKLALLLILCLESALPWGGKIGVSRVADRWSMTASGKRQKIEPGLWDLVTNPKSDTSVSASEVHFALVLPLADQMKRCIDITMDPETITLSF